MSGGELKPQTLPTALAPDDDIVDPDMADMDYSGPTDLPKGIKKEIMRVGESWQKPKTGDDVTVHYVGTLEADGSEFDSSVARAKPFEFVLGKGQVIKGWDEGVATMKKGEKARFTVAPEFAYGDAGSPPKIPEKATLIFEIELLSWSSKDDLFGDDGVIKTLLGEGTGWKTPKNGDEVLVFLKAETADGTEIEVREDFEYVIGSEGLGPLSRVCDKALVAMKKREEVSLKCSKDYAYGDKHPDGAKVRLFLKQIYETKDVSLAKDGSLMKKQLVEGLGYDTPKDSAKVKLDVDAATDGAGSPIPSFKAVTLEFVAGNGEVCDALEIAVSHMKDGEKALLTVASAALVSETQLGLQDTPAGQVVLTVVLTSFEKAKEHWNMSEEEKVEFATARKEAGGRLFKAGRIEMALERYKKVNELLSYTDSMKGENKVSATDLKKVCDLNKAMCYLKLKDYVETKKCCNGVLKTEGSNAKAIYRRAQADIGLKNFDDAIADCKRLIDVDPQNKDARALLKQARAGQREEDKKSQGMFSNMCNALGKGAIPEPYKLKDPCKSKDEAAEAESERNDQPAVGGS